MFAGAALAVALLASPFSAQVRESGQGVTLDFVGADVRAVVQALSPYLDRPVAFGQVNGVITLQSPRPVPPSEVLGYLRTALSINNFEMVEEGNSYVVRPRATVQPALEAPRSPVGRSVGGVELSVIRLRHARAVDVAATVNALYGRASALGELGRPSTLSGELRDNRNAAFGDAATAAMQTPQRSGRFESEVAIVPDARTNSLLIRATRGDFELIQAAVNQVDLRPLQVIIQVTIAEVRRNTDLSYALSASVGEQAVPGSGNTRVGGVTSGAARQDLVIRATGIGGVDLGLTLRAGVTRGIASILSQPIVFAANNERAEIVVGDQLPFVQLRRSGEGGIVDQVVQYKDVGTRLSVLPTISADGYVQLQVTQEINNATGVTGPDETPTISTRSVETSLLVRDGRTAVLGGLSRVTRERNSSGIPFLSDIPILGGIFGSKRRNADDTEIYILLTPRVVRDDAEMDSTTEVVRRNGGRAGQLSRKNPVIEPKPGRAAPPARPPGRVGAPERPPSPSP